MPSAMERTVMDFSMAMRAPDVAAKILDSTFGNHVNARHGMTTEEAMRATMAKEINDDRKKGVEGIQDSMLEGSSFRMGGYGDAWMQKVEKQDGDEKPVDANEADATENDLEKTLAKNDAEENRQESDVDDENKDDRERKDAETADGRGERAEVDGGEKPDQGASETKAGVGKSGLEAGDGAKAERPNLDRFVPEESKDRVDAKHGKVTEFDVKMIPDKSMVEVKEKFGDGCSRTTDYKIGSDGRPTAKSYATSDESRNVVLTSVAKFGDGVTAPRDAVVSRERKEYPPVSGSEPLTVAKSDYKYGDGVTAPKNSIERAETKIYDPSKGKEPIFKETVDYRFDSAEKGGEADGLFEGDDGRPERKGNVGLRGPGQGREREEMLHPNRVEGRADGRRVVRQGKGNVYRANRRWGGAFHRSGKRIFRRGRHGGRGNLQGG